VGTHLAAAGQFPMAAHTRQGPDQIRAIGGVPARGSHAYARGVFKRRRRPKWVNGTLRCSFCGKPRAEVKTLIGGPGVCICDECVGLCNDIVDKERTANR
jgi:hypothetical protein